MEEKLEEARGRLPVTAKLGEILRVKNMRSPGSIFRAWDTDGSQLISPIEFRDQMRSLGLEATDGEIDEMFREVRACNRHVECYTAVTHRLRTGSRR